jgi:hypothetical protein
MSITDVKSWVSLWNQSQATCNGDFAKIIEWVQRPISSCYFRLCKLVALAPSHSSFLMSLSLCSSLSLCHTQKGGQWWQGSDERLELGVRDANPAAEPGLLSGWFLTITKLSPSFKPKFLGTQDTWWKQNAGN